MARNEIPEWKKAYNEALRKYNKDYDRWSDMQYKIEQNLGAIKQAGSADNVRKSLANFLAHSDNAFYDAKIICKHSFHDNKQDEISFPKDMLVEFLKYCERGINESIKSLSAELSLMYQLQEPVRPQEEDFYPQEK